MSEHAHQAAYFDWVEIMSHQDERYQNIFAIPNGAWLAGDRRTRCRLANKLKREGLKKGVLDIFIAVPVNGLPGKFLETKFGKNKPTIEQKDWIKRLAPYSPQVCYGFEELKTATEYYFNGIV